MGNTYRNSVKNMIRKGDIILLVALLFVGGLFWYFLAPDSNTDDAKVVITVDKKVYGEYPLDEDKKIQVRENGHKNIIEIKGGKVCMTDSDCHNQDCVHQGAISKKNESIVCLPNKVVVSISGGEESDIDSTVR